MTGPSEKPAAASSRTKSTAENVKETLESIVVAFVLAFVFRAFIVEAFVIPTGSMAVTLYGAQLTKTCSTCGYEYALGVTLPSPEHLSLQLRCPNCNMGRDKFDTPELLRPDSGDRILVHKWPFDIGGAWLGPRRWDVTVFKDPRDGTTNFIKRLVGMPGEVLEIIDGDIYAAPLAELKKQRPALVEQLDELRLEVYRRGATGGDSQNQAISDRYAALNRELLPFLKIQHKTAHAQEALWFNVYNHDFLPNYDSLNPEQLRTRVGWQPVDEGARAAWDTSKRTIAFNSTGDRPLYVRFEGKPIDDFCAYNNDGGGNRPSWGYPVGDLDLTFEWLPQAGAGGLVLEMSRNRDKFVAELNVDGAVKLERRLLDTDALVKEWLAKTKPEPFRRDRATRIEFMNVDYRVSLLIDGEIVVTTGEDYQPQQEDLAHFTEAVVSRQDIQGLVRPSVVQIGARNLRCELLHVVLQRDVYYRSHRQSEVRSQESPYPVNPYHDWRGWGTAGQPILLRPDGVRNGTYYHAEYFMLGDNSPASKDSRLWWEIGPHLKHLAEEYQVGTVPGDQLIGKAFFVYWPAGYRSAWTGGIGLIPNFGRMRWIR